MSKFKSFMETLRQVGGNQLRGRFSGSNTPGEFLENLLFRRQNPHLTNQQIAGETAGLRPDQIMDNQINLMRGHADDTWDAMDPLVSSPYKSFQHTAQELRQRTFDDTADAFWAKPDALRKTREDAFVKLNAEVEAAGTASRTEDGGWMFKTQEDLDAYRKSSDDIYDTFNRNMDANRAARDKHFETDVGDMPLPAGFKEAMDKERVRAFNRAKSEFAEHPINATRRGARYAGQEKGVKPFLGIPSWILNHPKTVVAGTLVGMGASGADNLAGLAYGGPGYGSYTGAGDGFGGGRNNVFQGANVNMNFEAQTMGINELTSNQILPQGNMGTAPMMSRRMGRQFQNSAQGLTLGLHKGRRGGY